MMMMMKILFFITIQFTKRKRMFFFSFLFRSNFNFFFCPKCFTMSLGLQTFFTGWLAVYYRLFFLFVILSNKQTKEAKNKNFPTMFLEIIYLPNGKKQTVMMMFRKIFQEKKSFLIKTKLFLFCCCCFSFSFFCLFVLLSINFFH